MRPTIADRLIHSTLIVGFLAVDFLLFHDVLKPGETVSPVSWLIGVLSALVFVASSRTMIDGRARDPA